MTSAVAEKNSSDQSTEIIPPYTRPSIVDWSEEMMVEITLPKTSNYKKVYEILTRIGVVSKDQKTLYQSCHILKMDDKLWLVHFKELFALRGNGSTFSTEDLRRRQSIIALLTQWNYITPVVMRPEYSEKVDTRGIVVLPTSQKVNWSLETKYSLLQN
jgi:hypothetical protein